MQDMYTRLLSANLDFDPELQHVFCWAHGECRDSRVFHVDRVFSPSLLNVVLASGLGVSNVTRVVVGSFDENTRFFLVTVCILVDPAETLVSSVSLLSGRQRWKSAENVALSISVSLSSFYSACLSQCFWNDPEKISMSLCKC